MPRLTINFFSLLLSCLLVSCGKLDSSDDPFFACPQEQWMDCAQNLPSKRLFELSRIVSRRYGRDVDFKWVLADRGREGVIAVIVEFRDQKLRPDVHPYSTIFYDVRALASERSNYEFCEDTKAKEMLYEVAKANIKSEYWLERYIINTENSCKISNPE